MLIGAQVYTLRDYAQNERDFGRSMERVAKIGYTCVQLSGIGDIPAKSLRKICDDNGLKIAITHNSEDKFLNHTEQLIEDHKTLGCKYVGMGAAPGRYRTESWLPYFKEDYGTVIEKLHQAGLHFMYHNHNLDFAKFSDGRFFIDHLMDYFPAEQMGITADIYWLQAGGVDPVQWLKGHSDRIPCVHFKDYAAGRNYDTKMAPVGEGNLNMADIIAVCNKAGTEYALVEQDDCYGRDPFECLKTSYEALKKLGCH